MSFDPVQSSPDANAVRLDSLEALGSLLRQTREARGLSLSEVAHDTFIRTQYLDALERGDLSLLPEVVYVQGFLKRYADYLGLQGDALQKHSLLLFQNQQKANSPAPVSTLPRQEPTSIPLRPMHLWTAYVVVVVFAVGALSALLEGRSPSLTRWLRANRPSSTDQLAREQENERSSSPDAVASLSPQNTPQSSPDIAPSNPTSSGDQDQNPIPGVFGDPQDTARAENRPVKLDIRVVERPSWLRVVADGQVEFEGTLQPGAERNWSADQSIVLRAGNAGGVLVTFNDEDLGVMGSFGEVKEQVFQRPQNPQIQ